MKKSEPDYGRIARYIANSIDRFHRGKRRLSQGESVRVKTKWERKGEKCYSYISAERDFLDSINKRTPVPLEAIGTIMYLYCGEYMDNEEDAMKSLVMNFLDTKNNELDIHNIRQLEMKMELSGE